MTSFASTVSKTASTNLPPVPEPGLSQKEAIKLASQGKSNKNQISASRSYGRIVRDNVFTLFNGIMFACLVAVLVTGEWRDAAFSVIALVNTAIGTIAEIHAKQLLDHLTILIASKPLVRRDGRNRPLDASFLVPGDLVWLRSGEQVPADGRIVHTWGAEIDESMLTGESRPIEKKEGDTVYSGSTLVSGLALAAVSATGSDAYVARLTAQAKVYKKVHSDLQDGINKILQGLVWVVIPLAILLLISQIHLETKSPNGSWQSAVISTVAGIVSLIPQGLVLLTSVNFALSAIRLAQKKVLIQQLNSIETLARVDSLNLDKTGTITDGGIVLDRILPLGTEYALKNGKTQCVPNSSLLAGLRLVFAEPSPNATGRAILSGLDRWEKKGLIDSERTKKESGRIPFSSERKWSAARDEAGCSWIAGAPQFVLSGLPSADPPVGQARREAERAANNGSRVLVLAVIEGLSKDLFMALSQGLDHLPSQYRIRPVALILCSESVRPQAASTLAYFRQQGVRCRIISGDDPRTVAAIARKVNLVGQNRSPRWMDARELKNDPAGVAEQIKDIDVLGRVLPQQKKLIVQAQHLVGKTVGMTGDGVNDTLAIKEADFGIAMGNAAPATKSVADAVLLDSDFTHLPDVVAQGRRVMANMERVASLFLVKTFYSIIITVGTILLATRFPYLPRHMSYISPLCIGIPAFILSLPPNDRRYRPGFLLRVLRFSLPAGLAIGLSTLTFSRVLPLMAGWDPNAVSSDLKSLRTCVALVLFVLSLLVLAEVCRPLRSWRGVLVLAMAGCGIAGAYIPPVARFFQIVIPDDILVRWILLMVLSTVLLFFLFEWVSRLILKALWKHHAKNPLRLHWWIRKSQRK